MKNMVEKVSNDGPAFCPKCGTPVSRSVDGDDDSRLCSICGWWGDRTEVLDKPLPSDEFNPVLAASQALELYRGQCRRELVLEIAYDDGAITDDDLREAKLAIQQSTFSLVEMFTALWKNLHKDRPDE